MALLNSPKERRILIDGVQLEFLWSERQYNLPGHVANKIGIGALIQISTPFLIEKDRIMTCVSKNLLGRLRVFFIRMLTSDLPLGATRNVIVRGIHPSITEERIRENLDHIHNLVVISISFKYSDAYISLNSINNALFARTCMMSRATYKGMKIEWYPDECSKPLPKMEYAPKKAKQAAPQPKKFASAMNRFQMLNMDGTENEAEETDEEPTVLSDFSSMNLSSQKSPWKPLTVAA